MCRFVADCFIIVMWRRTSVVPLLLYIVFLIQLYFITSRFLRTYVHC